MDQDVQTQLTAIIAKDTWAAEDHEEMLKLLCATKSAPRKVRKIAADIESANPEPNGAAALKVGIARFMLCRFSEALAVLGDATDNKDRRYFQGQCLKALRQYDRAAEEFQRAADRGWDATSIALILVEMQALSGDADGAEKALGKLSKKAGDSAEFAYLDGLIAEMSGQKDRAVEGYDRARQIDPNHTAATFRLAYYNDLHGDEETAIELYKECLSHPPVLANAILNLAVLFEDAGQYEQAAAYLKRLLAINPNHERAKLFLKDVESSMSMYYDEDQAWRIARRNAVLDIPVTDFELSVRARNCLKKMNIRTLGNLVDTTESELLGYKNFGETSLKEIKDMLTAKGLSLGAPAEMEESDLFGVAASATEGNVKNEGVLATRLALIDLSIRARKALETLRLQTLGDLVAKSEAELLACKNFGQTSLHEIRQRLSEYGLRLHEPD